LATRFRPAVRVSLYALACLASLALAGAPKPADDDKTSSPTATAAPVREAQPRHPSLVPLYFSFATLEALDVASTARVIEGGGRESNPIVASVWGSPVGLAALKAGTAAGLIVAAQRLRKDHPKTALVLMIAANSGMTAIVAHNYAIARR
jgi:hypothetical protein